MMHDALNYHFLNHHLDNPLVNVLHTDDENLVYILYIVYPINKQMNIIFKNLRKDKPVSSNPT